MKEYITEMAKKGASGAHFFFEKKEAAYGASEIFKSVHSEVRIYLGNLPEEITSSKSFLEGLEDMLRRKIPIKIILEKDSTEDRYYEMFRLLRYYFILNGDESIKIKTGSYRIHLLSDGKELMLSFILGDANLYWLYENRIRFYCRLDFNNPQENKIFADSFDRLFGHESSREFPLFQVANEV